VPAKKKTTKKTSARKKRPNKPEPPPKDTISVHVLYSQVTTGGEALSNEPYASRAPEHTTTTFKGAVVGGDPWSPWNYDTFEVPRDAFSVPRSHIYAVVGYYSDGDSFHSSYGNMHIVDVYGNPEKAHAVAVALQKEDKKAHQSIFGSAFHVPWGGYFSRLESIQIEVLPVLGIAAIGSDNRDPKDIPSW